MVVDPRVPSLCESWCESSMNISYFCVCVGESWSTLRVCVLTIIV